MRIAGDGTIGFPAQKELKFDGGDDSSTDKETGFKTAAQQAIRQIGELHSESEKLWQMNKYKKPDIQLECELWKEELRSVRRARRGISFDEFVGAEAALMANPHIAEKDVPYQPRGLFWAKQALKMMLQTSSLFKENPDEYTELKDISVRLLHVLDHLINLIQSNFPRVHERVLKDTIEGANGGDWGGVYDPMPADYNSEVDEYQFPVLLY